MSHALKDTISKQHATERRNLFAVAKLCTQVLCDESGTCGVIDENSDHLPNFCNIIEAILCHGYKYPNNKKYGGSPDGIVYWDFIRVACKSVPYNCIAKITAIDDAKTLRGKGRAWIRMALMEKRLSEYLSVALMEEAVMRRFYERGSYMLSEEAHMLTNVLTALNCIDFSLCLRNSALDAPIAYPIDYSPFLKYPISDRQLDVEEALIRLERNRLFNDASSSCSGHASTLSDREVSSTEEELKKMKRQMKLVVDQKAYLEEILRLKEVKCGELTQQLLQWDAQTEREKRQTDGVIVELQQQLQTLQDRNRVLERRCGSGGGSADHINEMDPVQPVLRRNTTLQSREFRPSESDSGGGCRGVDVVAQLDKNGYCSRSSSDQSVKRSTSDQSVQRSTDTLQTRTSSLSGGSRPRSKSRPASKQRIAVAVEDILPSEKERLLFNVHKTMKEESFISFGEAEEN